MNTFLLPLLDASAQWAAYYAQYYAQAQAVPTTQAGAAAAGAGQTDYTQQWIEYLRAQGQHQQADMLEKQMKQSQGNGTNGTSSAGGDTSGTNSSTTTSAASTSNSTTASTATTAAAAGANGADYSQAWADHYRSIGKIAEAEQIEAYIKAQKVVFSFLITNLFW